MSVTSRHKWLNVTPRDAKPIEFILLHHPIRVCDVTLVTRLNMKRGMKERRFSLMPLSKRGAVMTGKIQLRRHEPLRTRAKAREFWKRRCTSRHACQKRNFDRKGNPHD